MTATNQLPDFPLLEIASFVDSTTVVLIGHQIDEIEVGDELYVLGVGFSVIPTTNVPLISPKAELEVTFAPGPYVLAKAELREVRLRPAMETLLPSLSLTTERTALRRPVLSDNKNAFLGDPGSEPIKVGDTVIRKRDVRAFVSFRAKQSP